MGSTKKWNCHTQKKAPSEIRTPDPYVARTATSLLPRYVSCTYRPRLVRTVRTNRRLDILTKKRKQNPLPGDDASTAEAALSGVERDEQGEARRANTTPNGGPHLERGRLRLKTGSKSDFSIAETWPTYPYKYLFRSCEIENFPQK